MSFKCRLGTLNKHFSTTNDEFFSRMIVMVVSPRVQFLLCPMKVCFTRAEPPHHALALPCLTMLLDATPFPHHIAPYRTMIHHALIISQNTVPYRIHASPSPIMLHHVVTYHNVPHHIARCLNMPPHFASCRTKPHHVPPCLIISILSVHPDQVHLQGRTTRLVADRTRNLLMTLFLTCDS